MALDCTVVCTYFEKFRKWWPSRK